MVSASISKVSGDHSKFSTSDKDEHWLLFCSELWDLSDVRTKLGVTSTVPSTLPFTSTVDSFVVGDIMLSKMKYRMFLGVRVGDHDDLCNLRMSNEMTLR